MSYQAFHRYFPSTYIIIVYVIHSQQTIQVPNQIRIIVMNRIIKYIRILIYLFCSFENDSDNLKTEETKNFL